MTNPLSQAETPLLTMLCKCARENHAPFYTPGHKRGVGISEKLVDVLGKAVFTADLAELTELDNLFAPSGVIAQAQQLASEAFGAARTWFLVNGSTCGVEAAILATCSTGDKIILPRNVHSSVIAGLVLSGAMPIFINPEYDAVLDIAHSITPDSVAAALQQHPDAKAVLMIYPTYYGVCGDVAAIANITHRYNIPLLVDEAHGAHFAFHHQLPMPALQAGADICIQSIHKTLGAMTQASMLHVQGDRVNYHRVSKALQLLQSTSPSYILMASLDAARSHIALHGKELLSRTLQLADTARKRIQQIPGLSVLDFSNLSKFNKFNITQDLTRLTVRVWELGLTGFAADEILETEFGVRSELASWQNVTFIISLGNTQEDIEKLVQGFIKLAQRFITSALDINHQKCEIISLFDVTNQIAMSPRQAFFAATETVEIDKSCDRICAEIICPYPPGIPILMPGEIITESSLNYLQKIQVLGGTITGCQDTSLQTLKVVAIPSSLLDS
ncbi:aminotransferase class I/II-fold pyridoxal phosphate-dependent enzyme [Calothrix sp. UHCC 0171]|uniref:aminotransferase class I/II-fold pyridoxal phosphate-dependent enzyme n=1 Tax=Calothrix sp. UHCC 0171 TaxID=3110245 RepID=UPI002B1EC836|nr:aminotransferase class I/II-fold pyridoxal phosphate-dependent enzyme [Calothrix sp. UHCC 0171]MEA5570157.1 aminotransferase class I/II-fold pyridoxal phosphate-dependent enzyme [Calothrix sp. UHCC 0171]